MPNQTARSGPFSAIGPRQVFAARFPIGLVKNQSPKLTMTYNWCHQGRRGASNPAMEQPLTECIDAGYAALVQARWSGGSSARLGLGR